MSWTYSGNPASSTKDFCRFTIGDVIEEDSIMQDEEIQYIIDTYSNTNKQMFELFKIASTRFARDIKRRLGPESEDPTERTKFFKEQMDYYKALCVSGDLSLPTYAAPQVFGKGMQSNPPNRSGLDA